MILHPIPAAELDRWWPVILPFVNQMAERFPDDWPAHEQYRAAEAEQIVLWAILDEDHHKALGIFATRKQQLPSGRWCMSIPICAGNDHKLWQTEVREHVERMARMNDCTIVESVGRPGWLREAPGFKPIWVGLFRKELAPDG